MKKRRNILCILLLIVSFYLNINNVYAENKDERILSIDESKIVFLKNQHGGSGGTFGSTDDDCAIFGDKNTEGTISYEINNILNIIKFIVPGLVVLLGTIDLSKAVLAGNEDEMKKAQKTFIKRVILGACVFLVPTIVNLIMTIADDILTGPVC